MVVVDETNEEDEEMQRAVAASMESMKDSCGVAAEDKDASVTVTGEEETCSSKKQTYPPLPEEPKGDRNLLCRVGFRLPDGRRVQRNFFRTDPIQVRTFLKLMLCCIIHSFTQFYKFIGPHLLFSISLMVHFLIVTMASYPVTFSPFLIGIGCDFVIAYSTFLLSGS